MNYETEVKPREAEGKSDADIAAEIDACGLTPRKLPLHDLTGGVLYPAGLLTKEANGDFSGPLVAAASNDAYPQQLRDAIKTLLATLSDQRIANIDTTNPTIAAKTCGVMRGLVAASLLTSDLYTAIYAFAGGELFAGTTGEQVTGCRADYVESQRKDALRARKEEANSALGNAIDAGATEEEALAAWQAKWEAH